MLQNASLRMKILLSSSITIILLIVIGIIGNSGIQSLTYTNKWVDHTHTVIGEANSILASAVDMETGMRGYLLAGKEDFLDPYNNGREQLYIKLNKLSETVSDNPAQVMLLKEIRNNMDDWQSDVTEPTIELRREISKSKTMDDVRDLVREARGKVYVDKMRSQIDTFIKREAVLLVRRQRIANRSSNVAELKRAIRQVNHTYEVMGTAKLILAAIVDMETGMRGYMLAGLPKFLDPYNAGITTFDTLVTQLSKTVDDNPAQVELLKEIRKTCEQWQKEVTEPSIALRTEIGDAKSMNDMAELVAQAKGKKYFDKFRDQIALFIEREEAHDRTKRESRKNNSKHSTLYSSIYTCRPDNCYSSCSSPDQINYRSLQKHLPGT